MGRIDKLRKENTVIGDALLMAMIERKGGHLFEFKSAYTYPSFQDWNRGPSQKLPWVKGADSSSPQMPVFKDIMKRCNAVAHTHFLNWDLPEG